MGIDFFKWMKEQDSPLIKLVNCGSSCYFDSLIVMFFCGPTSYVYKKIIEHVTNNQNNESVDENQRKWEQSFCELLVKCVFYSTQQMAMIDQFHLRKLIHFRQTSFRPFDTNSPAELLHCLADLYPTLKHSVQVQQNDKWESQNWPFCLSNWMNFSRFRSSYDSPILIIDCEDSNSSAEGCYKDWKFTEKLSNNNYRCYGSVQRVCSGHYVSVFASKNLVWYYYDDSRPGLYFKFKTLPKHSDVFKPLDNQLNGSVLLFYVRDDWLNK